MKTIAAILLLPSCLLSCRALGQDNVGISAAEAACGPRGAGFEVSTDDSRHPTPAPEDGKPLIYVVQESPGSTRVGADGKWIGALKRGTYFSISIDPGEHHLCAIGHIGVLNSVSLHELSNGCRRYQSSYFGLIPIVPSHVSTN
jgi:hypothetical protein